MFAVQFEGRRADSADLRCLMSVLAIVLQQRVVLFVALLWAERPCADAGPSGLVGRLLLSLSESELVFSHDEIDSSTELVERA